MNMRVFFELLVAGLCVVAYSEVLADTDVRKSREPQRIKLFDFANGTDVQGMYVKPMGKHGSYSIRHDPVRGCVVYDFTNLEATVNFPQLSRRLAERCGELKPEIYYVKYRAPRYQAYCEAQFTAGKSFHAAYLSIDPCETVSVALTHPRWGYHRDGPYEPESLDAMFFKPHGTGTLEFYEVGVVVDEVPHQSPRDPTPIDPKAFAVVPEPRVWRLTGGAFPLPRRCLWSPGDLPPAAKADFVKEMQKFHRVEMVESEPDRAVVAFSLAKSLGDVRYDGFSISTTREGVRVRALEPAGLAYAAQTLAELVWRAGGRRIPCFELRDWPQYELRPWEDQPVAFFHENHYEVPVYCDMLRRFVLPARYNRIAHYMDCYFEWRSPALKHRPQAWSAEEYAAVVDYVNGYGLRMLPTQQTLGHQDYFMCWQDNAKRFGEDGRRQVYCTRNPDVYPVLFDAYDQLIEICSRHPTLKPDYFLSCHDEVNWTNTSVPISNRCTRCAGIPRNQLFLEDVRKCNEHLHSKDLRQVIFTDMLAPAHTGYDPFHCADIVDNLPRSVVLASWTYPSDLSIEDFAGRGFENWKICTGFSDSPVGDDRIKAMGFGNYTYNWWLSRTRCGYCGVYGLLGARLQAYYAWRGGSPAMGDGDLLARKYGNFLMRGWSRKPIFGNGVETSLGDDEVKATKESVTLPRPGMAASLVFTHAVDFTEEGKKSFFSPEKYHDPDFGPLVAVCHVKYDDGSVAQIEMRYGWNVADVHSRGSQRNELFSRYLADCRQVIANAEDTEVRYEYEWANPHPEKPIVSLSLVAVRPELSVYRLFELKKQHVR